MKLHVDEARERLAVFKKQLEVTGQSDPAEREFKNYLQMQITTYENAIKYFEKDKDKERMA